MIEITQDQHQLVLILDFGGQYKELIARRVRECGVGRVVYDITRKPPATVEWE